MKTKRPKKFPMDGPPLHIQRLMMSPRRNREELVKYFAANPGMRPETAAVLNLK